MAELVSALDDPRWEGEWSGGFGRVGLGAGPCAVLATDATSQQIAEALFLSPRTVEQPSSTPCASL
ncbi:hypothetical protein [Kitasatospora cinereorecta]|uniref:Uncharacterized protein n=1 Tax=Kitasatospora cinereorecta TaxID=285560 RepID=A0ABW0VIB2_9ACTN